MNGGVEPEHSGTRRYLARRGKNRKANKTVIFSLFPEKRAVIDGRGRRGRKVYKYLYIYMRASAELVRLSYAFNSSSRDRAQYMARPHPRNFIDIHIYRDYLSRARFHVGATHECRTRNSRNFYFHPNLISTT